MTDFTVHEIKYKISTTMRVNIHTTVVVVYQMTI